MMKFLFAGDGVTAAGRSPDGLGEGYVTVVSGLVGASFYDRDPVFLNRAYEGERLSDLAARFSSEMAPEAPALLTLLVGTQDALAAEPTSVSEFRAQYFDLLVRIDKESHPSKLLLMEPFLLPVGEIEPKYERLYPVMCEYQSVLHKLCRETGAELVELQSAFFKASRLRPNEYWTADGVHPTPAGHGLIAGEWISAAKKLVF